MVSFTNVQSIRRKDSILYDHLHSVKCDISVITETWLRDDEAEAVWVQWSALCINEYNFFTSNCKDQPGGGLGLVICKDFSTKLLEEGAKTSFQYAKWSISCKNRVLKIAAIYHPPYSARNLVQALTRCKYPAWVLNRVKIKTKATVNKNSRGTNNSGNNNQKPYMVIPYYKGVSDSIKKTWSASLL